MTEHGNFRVRDLAEMFLTLRQDLTITPRHDGDEPGYLIEDKVSGKFYRIGVPEYTFIALLDGKTAVREAVAIAACVELENAVTEEQATTICRWLVDNQLAFTTESVSTPGLEARRTDDKQQPDQPRWNPFFLRISLFRPERLLRRLLPWTSWLFSWPATIGTALLGMIAANLVLTNWDRFLTSSRGILSTDRWLWIAVAWLVVKVVHELAHGIVCKRYGGSVRDAGVVLILGAPAAYMDVTSSWQFRSKWHKVHTAAAGIYIELLIAAVAAILWSRGKPGVMSDLYFQVMMLASVGTVLFNANPLMRFDGYYILSDLLELPNLYGESQQYWLHLIRKYALGLESQFAWSGNRRIVLAMYGAAAFVWQIIVYCSLTLAASTALRGAGLVMVIGAVGIWLGPKLIAAIKYLACGSAWEQPRRLRFLTVTAGATVALLTVLLVVPWPCAYRAPAMVEYAPLMIVRTASDGFVREVRVAFGQQVEPGQVLVVLENESLRLEVAELQIRLQQSTSLVRALRYDAKTADSQSMLEHQAALKKRLREKSEQLAALTLRAPLAGTVVTHDLDCLPGTYLKRGAEVMVLGQEDHKEVNISIAQEDVDIFTDYLQQTVWVRLHGSSLLPTSLARVAPRARMEPSSEGFCAPLGGPLPVRVIQSMSTQGESQYQYELLAPRFDAALSLSREQSLALSAGQRGFVALRARNRSIAEHLLRRLQGLLQTTSKNLPQVL